MSEGEGWHAVQSRARGGRDRHRRITSGPRQRRRWALPRSAQPAHPPRHPKFRGLALFACASRTFLSTLNTRFPASGSGLSAVRVHAGFDEGAWITTAQTLASGC